MNCIEARETMLSAEPDELLASGDGELARHVRECAVCAARARSLVNDLGVLSVEVGRGGRKTIRRTAIIAALPIAAGIVAIVVSRTRQQAPASSLQPADVVSVQIEPGQQATVLKTKDPKVTVVWLSTGGGAP